MFILSCLLSDVQFNKEKYTCNSTIGYGIFRLVWVRPTKVRKKCSICCQNIGNEEIFYQMETCIKQMIDTAVSLKFSTKVILTKLNYIHNLNTPSPKHLLYFLRVLKPRKRRKCQNRHQSTLFTLHLRHSM